VISEFYQINGGFFIDLQTLPTTDLAVDIKKACCVFHNYVLEKNGYVFQDTLTIDGFNEIERQNNINRGTRFVSDIRNTFADIP